MHTLLSFKRASAIIGFHTHVIVDVPYCGSIYVLYGELHRQARLCETQQCGNAIYSDTRIPLTT